MNDDIKGGIWRPDPLDMEPVTELYQWQVFEVPSIDQDDRDRHFVGTCRSDPGRVSSRIMDFNKETMTGTSRSGRKYKLVGMPGFHNEAAYVWSRFMSINKIDEKEVTNVTERYR